MARTPARRWLLVALLATLAGCTEKTEQQQLDALREGLGYRSYRQFSERGVPLAYEGYVRSAQMSGETPPPLTADDLCAVHTLLSYTALSANKLLPAVVEADLLERDCGREGAMIANALRSVAFHRKQWPGLALEASNAAWRDAPDPDRASALIVALHLLMGYAAVTDQHWDQAQVHIDALGVMLQAPWLGELGQAGLELQQQRYLDGLRRLKRVSENPAVPPVIREELQGIIERIEAETGNLDSRLLLAKVLGKALWQAAREHGSPGLQRLLGFAETRRWSEAAAATTTDVQGWWKRFTRRWRRDDGAGVPESPSS